MGVAARGVAQGPAPRGHGFDPVYRGLNPRGPAAKNQFLHWQQWDLYTKPPQSVRVGYVWNSSYSGFRFPNKVTTVFKVKAPPRSVYWRSTTLEISLRNCSGPEALACP